MHFPTHLNTVPLIFICLRKVLGTILHHGLPPFRLNHTICQFYALKNGHASTIALVPPLCLTKHSKKRHEKGNLSPRGLCHRQWLRLSLNSRKGRTWTVPASFATRSRLSHSSRGPRHLARKVCRVTQSRGSSRSSAPTRKMGSTTMYPPPLFSFLREGDTWGRSAREGIFISQSDPPAGGALSQVAGYLWAHRTTGKVVIKLNEKPVLSFPNLYIICVQ